MQDVLEKEITQNAPNEATVEEPAVVKKATYQLSAGQKFYRFVKAIVDFFIAFFVVLFLWPVYLVVAIAIKIDSPGPVFFSQKRIGKDGKLFSCIKFRSMSQEARHDVAGYEYREAGSYVTKVGAFIRKYSIDELPQFFNLLNFRMSLIGYRPSQANEKTLNNARESYNMYQIRPGISGWAQVNGRDILAAKPAKKAEFDAYYLEHFSPWLDIKIIFMTVVSVFKHSDVVEGVIEDEKKASGKEAPTEIASKEKASEETQSNDSRERHDLYV